MARYGIGQQLWDAAKEEVRNLLIACARVRGMIAYSDLVQKIRLVRFEARDIRLFNMLGEISEEEDAAGRGMLSALVVHKVGDMEPGPGFFDLAEKLGRDTTDITKCWVEEMHKVHRAWS